MILWTLLMITPLFNTQQNTTSLYSKGTINAGSYKIRVHANTLITKAESDYWKCNISGQDAVCGITLPQAKSGIFLSTLTLQKRSDDKYVLDYSNSDEAVRPSPSILNTSMSAINNGVSNSSISNTSISAVNNNKVSKTTKRDNSVSSNVINNKRTWINLTIIWILLLLLLWAYKLTSVRKN